MADLNKKELRRLAEKATPGLWDYDGSYVCTTRVVDGTTYVESWSAVADAYLDDDVRFIAAANPATILALLDELERLENDNRSKNGSMKAFGEQIAKLQRAVKNRDKRLEKAEAENDAAVAELEACRKDALYKKAVEMIDGQDGMSKPIRWLLESYVGELAKGCNARGSAVLGAGIGALLEPAKDDGEGGANG